MNHLVRLQFATMDVGTLLAERASARDYVKKQEKKGGAEKVNIGPTNFAAGIVHTDKVPVDCCNSWRQRRQRWRRLSLPVQTR